MSLPTVAVTIVAYLASGAALPFGVVRFTLTGLDVDGSVILPEPIDVVLDENGIAVVQLFPNVDGSQGTRYQVEFYTRWGSRILPPVFATVPAANCSLHNIINLPAPGTITTLYAGFVTVDPPAGYTSTNAQGLFVQLAGTVQPPFIFVDDETPVGVINGSNTVFTLSAAPSPAASLQLFRNGLLQAASGVDYTLTTNSIAYVIAPSIGDAHACWYRH